MDEQVSQSHWDIDRSLTTLIRGLTQDNREEIYKAYKTLFQVGAPAIPQIRAAIFKSNWSNLKYPNENRYVSGLVNLIHDIDESEARRIANQLKNNGCDSAVVRFLDSICAFTLADYTQYEVCGVKVFEHKKLVEIGHHVHRHMFGEDPNQEKEADKYSGRIMANSHPLLFRIYRWFTVAWRWSIRAFLIRALLDSKLRRRRSERR